MVKLKPDDFDKAFTIDLLPVVISTDDITYVVEPGETYHYTRDILGIISHAAPNDDAKLKLIDQLNVLELNGGVFASLNQNYFLSEFEEFSNDYLSISMNKQLDDQTDFIHEKHIRFLLSGIPIQLDNEQYVKIERYCTDLLHQMFMNFVNRLRQLGNNKQFVRYLFTDSSVTINKEGNENFVLKFDPSLYEYLLNLSSRL